MEGLIWIYGSGGWVRAAVATVGRVYSLIRALNMIGVFEFWSFVFRSLSFGFKE